VLTISAERREEQRAEEEGTSFSEFRYGSFRRVLRVPRDVQADAVEASYQDGILTISVPMPQRREAEATKVPISRT
jgi:HSP20 family molecular chaperone IbpA